MTDVNYSPQEIPSRRHLTGVVNAGVFLLVSALGAAIYLTPLKTWLLEGNAIKAELALFGIAAPVVFTLVSAVLTAVGVPRLLLCSLAGLSFGFAWGLVWSQLATVLGSYSTFLFVRWRGRAYTLDHFPRLRRFSRNFESKGWISVLLLRQVPMNGFYNSLFLGLTAVSHRDFLLGSSLGFLPLGVTACLIGAGMVQGNLEKTVEYVVLALTCSVMLGWILSRLSGAYGHARASAKQIDSSS